MATIDDKNKTGSVLSDDAYELIECFYDGVDDLVYQLAEEMARKRNPSASPVQIEVEDVRAAGEAVVESLKRLFESGEIPDHVKEAIHGMGDCFDDRSR